ncbi:hypothetical protein HYH03_011237 [Edaphochlamys debaryana]|uniref:Guanylate cyclase domain-containing protein n=1 Tax=Edaphochlamys debaryana TaxID=47281 RepID=A0A836BVC0_9CHLO|nr:hypothetical protein HYH03_011237 [Edaphochlamys debaryana]|eukprot:KAG2490285.1 hypothetical protein HYH03_011237 [Edaphochlamys debaryana]
MPCRFAPATIISTKKELSKRKRGFGSLLACFRPTEAASDPDGVDGLGQHALVVRLSLAPCNTGARVLAPRPRITSGTLSHCGPITSGVLTTTVNTGAGTNTATVSAVGGGGDRSNRLLDLAWEGLPACVTVFTAEGAVAFQNAASRTYMGERVGCSTVRVAEGLAEIDGSCSELLRLLASRGSAAPMGSCSGRGGEAEVRLELEGREEGGEGGGGMLSRLFALDPSKQEQLLEATQLLGRRTARGAWEGIVRVPATLNPAGLPPTGADSSLYNSVNSRANARIARAATALLDAGGCNDSTVPTASPRRASTAQALRTPASPPDATLPHVSQDLLCMPSPDAASRQSFAAGGGRYARHGSPSGVTAPQWGSSGGPAVVGSPRQPDATAPPEDVQGVRLSTAVEEASGRTDGLLDVVVSLMAADAAAACDSAALSNSGCTSSRADVCSRVHSSTRRFTSMSPLATSTWGLMSPDATTARSTFTPASAGVDGAWSSPSHRGHQMERAASATTATTLPAGTSKLAAAAAAVLPSGSGRSAAGLPNGAILPTAAAAAASRGSSGGRGGEERPPSENMHTDQLGPLLDGLSMACSRRRATGAFGGSHSFTIRRPAPVLPPQTRPQPSSASLIPAPSARPCTDPPPHARHEVSRLLRSRSHATLNPGPAGPTAESRDEDSGPQRCEEHGFLGSAGSAPRPITYGGSIAMLRATRLSLVSPVAANNALAAAYMTHAPSSSYRSREGTDVLLSARARRGSALDMSSTGGVGPRILHFANSLRNATPSLASGQFSSRGGLSAASGPGSAVMTPTVGSVLLAELPDGGDAAEGAAGSATASAAHPQNQKPQNQPKPDAVLSRAISFLERSVDTLAKDGDVRPQQPAPSTLEQQQQVQAPPSPAGQGQGQGQAGTAQQAQHAGQPSAEQRQHAPPWKVTEAAEDVEEEAGGGRRDRAGPEPGLAWHEVRAAAVEDPDSGARYLVVMQRDVTAKVEAERHIAQVTILFADIQGFTPMCKQLPAAVVMKFLNDLFVRFDSLLDVHGVYKVETIGDCYVVAGGLIAEDADGMAAVQGGGVSDPRQADQVFSFAQAMLHAAAAVTLPTTGEPVRIRVGIHSGPVVSGVVGTRMPRFCLFGVRALSPDQRQGWAPTGGVEVKGKGRMDTFLWGGAEANSIE